MTPLLVGIALLLAGRVGMVAVGRREPPMRSQAPRGPAARLVRYLAEGVGAVLCLILIVLGTATVLLAWSAL